MSQVASCLAPVLLSSFPPLPSPTSLPCPVPVLQLFLEVNGDATKKYCSGQVQYIECFAEEKHRLFIMEILLHCADISNPYKPFQICAKWADLVSQEFFSQGDKERELGIDISPMMDRNSSNLNNMQIGFIEFVVSPLISSESSLSPPPPPPPAPSLPSL